MPRAANSEIAIRRASRADVAALGRLGASLVRTHHEFDTERFLTESPETAPRYGAFLGTQLDDSDVTILVAEERGVVIGYVYAAVEGYDYMSLRGPAGVLHDIVVDPDHRGRGIGRMLLDAALAFLAAHGAPRAVLSTAARNAPAQRLFERAGFRRTMIEMTVELAREPREP
jgi:ribosomal protein S18 acetylase RimI-like enzyme